MPYASDRQRRFFHTTAARRAGITPAMVREFDEASRAKEGAAGAYGVPKMPSAPKAPTLASPGTARPSSTNLGAVARTPALHPPVAQLQQRAMQRSSDSAAMNPQKVSGPPGT